MFSQKQTLLQLLEFNLNETQTVFDLLFCDPPQPSLAFALSAAKPLETPSSYFTIKTVCLQSSTKIPLRIKN